MGNRVVIWARATKLLKEARGEAIWDLVKFIALSMMALLGGIIAWIREAPGWAVWSAFVGTGLIMVGGILLWKSKARSKKAVKMPKLVLAGIALFIIAILATWNSAVSKSKTGNGQQ